MKTLMLFLVLTLSAFTLEAKVVWENVTNLRVASPIDLIIEREDEGDGCIPYVVETGRWLNDIEHKVKSTCTKDFVYYEENPVSASEELTWDIFNYAKMTYKIDTEYGDMYDAIRGRVIYGPNDYYDRYAELYNLIYATGDFVYSREVGDQYMSVSYWAEDNTYQVHANDLYCEITGFDGKCVVDGEEVDVTNFLFGKPTLLKEDYAFKYVSAIRDHLAPEPELGAVDIKVIQVQ